MYLDTESALSSDRERTVRVSLTGTKFISNAFFMLFLFFVVFVVVQESEFCRILCKLYVIFLQSVQNVRALEQF
jgi:hypothetical protein